MEQVEEEEKTGWWWWESNQLEVGEKNRGMKVGETRDRGKRSR